MTGTDAPAGGAGDGLGWLNDRQRDGGIDRISLPPGVRGSLWLCGKQAVATRYDAGAWDTIVCLVERHELDRRYPDYVTWLDTAVEAAIDTDGPGAVWVPIHDLHAPPLPVMADLVDRIVGELDRDLRVLVHCAAGKGRAGTTAVCVLVALGTEPDDALRTVAMSRPGAGPEAGAQGELVVEFAALVAGSARDR
jgi:protein-tyrosine phosphatase